MQTFFLPLSANRCLPIHLPSKLVSAFFLSATLLLVASSGLLMAETIDHPDAAWKVRLAKELPLMGHRNWIVVADSAYPAQTRPGIDTIYVGGDHLSAIETVLKSIDAARHVQAIPMIDAELPALPEADAAGIENFRNKLNELLKGRPVKRIPHENIIDELDSAAHLFRVLVIKTDMTLPYTSVFIELDCGYWGPEQETRLRQAIDQQK